jgi:hypothetical protein
MLRSFLTLCVFVLTLAAVAAQSTDSPAGTLDYGPITQPLERALNGIGGKLKLKLYAGNDIAAEPVVLRLKGVAAKDALDHLAQALSAEWVAYKDGQILTRTPAALEKANQALIQRRAEVIKKQLAILSEVRQKHPVLDPDSAREIAHQYADMMRKEQQGTSAAPRQTRQDLSNRTAEARLLQDMMLAIGPERLGALSADNRNVFSVAPTASQMAVPNMEPSRIDQFVLEDNALADAIQAEDQKGLHDGLLYNGIQQATQPLLKLPARICLVVTPARRVLDCELDVYDADGNKVSSSDWQLGRGDTDKWFRERAKYRAEAAKLPGIMLPAPVAALAARTHAAGSNDEPKPIDPGAVDYLLHPDVHDPLELGFSQAVLGIGEKEGLNVVATLSDDDIYFALTSSSNGEIKPQYFLLVMDHWTNESVKRSEGWLLAHPNDPVGASSGRVNRADLAKFMQEVSSQGFTTIENWAELAAGNTDAAYNIAITYRNMLEAQDWVYDYSNMAAYRLYGLLSDDQLSALKQGQGLPFNTLSPEEQSCVNTIALVQGQSFTNPTDKQHNYMESIHAEPTEEIPAGIPPNAELTMKENVVEQFYANTSTRLANETSDMRGEPMDMGWLAAQLAMTQRPDLFPLGVATVKALRYGHKRTIDFSMAVTSNAVFDARITEMQRPAGDPILISELKDRLPADVWKRLDEMVQSDLKNYKAGEAEIRKERPVDNSPPPPPRYFVVG